MRSVMLFFNTFHCWLQTLNFHGGRKRCNPPPSQALPNGSKYEVRCVTPTCSPRSAPQQWKWFVGPDCVTHANEIRRFTARRLFVTRPYFFWGTPSSCVQRAAAEGSDCGQWSVICSQTGPASLGRLVPLRTSSSGLMRSAPAGAALGPPS